MSNKKLGYMVVLIGGNTVKCSFHDIIKCQHNLRISQKKITDLGIISSVQSDLLGAFFDGEH